MPAGFVIKKLGIAWAFFVDAISFLFIIGALWKLPDPPVSASAQKSVLPAITEGLAYVGRDIPLRSLMLLTMIMNFCFAGPVSIGLTYMSKARFGSPAVLGTLLSAIAAGSLLGALLAGVWKIRRRGILIPLVAAAFAPCLGSIGFMSKMWPLAAVLFTIGVLAALLNVHIISWIMQRMDEAVRGRVSSVLILASYALTPVSFAVAGFLIAWNLKFTFLLAGFAMLLTAAGAALQKPVREIE